MVWMRFLSFSFNALGVLFLLSALIAFALFTGIGSGADPDAGPDLGAFMGGMMGLVGVFTNLFASLMMFFFGAVLFGLHRLIEEVQLRRLS